MPQAWSTQTTLTTGRFFRTAVSSSVRWNMKDESPVSSTTRRVSPTATWAPTAYGRPGPMLP